MVTETVLWRDSWWLPRWIAGFGSDAEAPLPHDPASGESSVTAADPLEKFGDVLAAGLREHVEKLVCNAAPASVLKVRRTWHKN
jgi:hypothetical protein